VARNLPVITQQFFDANGDPLSGGKVYSYQINSVIPKVTYTEYEGSTENTNPIILDANGMADIWCASGFYKFIITDANDVPVKTVQKIRVEPVDGSDAAAAASAVEAAASAAAAEVSRLAAEQAETNAETAETNAETAETNAETAQAAAEAAQTAAETAETNAETAATNASNSATTASGHATTAGTHATNAGNSATAAAASELAALNAADAAEDSADEAAANAAAALTHIADVANPHAVTKTQVGLGNADNTSDVNKPVSTAQQTALDLKAPLASPTFTGTVAGITKSMVGLGNVDNTSDASKPISTLTQTALDAKQATLVSATNIKTINSASILGSGDLVISASGVYTSKTADYTLTSSDDVIDYTALAANRVATLPTAVGISGKILTISRSVNSTNTLTIATTSSQTIGGRASSGIVLRRQWDFVRVQSDGANWQILGKKEWEWISAESAARNMSTIGGGNYGAMSAGSVAVSYGFWRITAFFSGTTGTGSGINMYSETGVYGANGADNSSVPTAASGTISGPTKYTEMGSSRHPWIPNSANSQWAWTTPIQFTALVTGNTTYYAVPRPDFGTAGTSNVVVFITAERLW
jgi:hypothetical protein